MKPFHIENDDVGYKQKNPNLGFSLMFDQYQYKQESLFGGMTKPSMHTLNVLLADKANNLKMTFGIISDNMSSMFTLSQSLHYDVDRVPYPKMANVQLDNIIGLRARLYLYILKLEECLEYATKILDFELPAVASVVAELVSDPDKLQSTKPIQSLTKMKIHLVDSTKIKEELSKMVTDNHAKPYVTFGESYYNYQEFKDGDKVANNMKNTLSKLDLAGYKRDIEDLTNLLEKLILRVETLQIPKANVRLYSDVIENASNNIAFAGATIHLTETLLNVLKSHNEKLQEEVVSYRKHSK